MQARKLLISCAAVIAGLTGFAAIEVTAAELSPAAPQPPPRQCTINSSGISVQIQAGPGSGSGLAAEFPVVEPCPSGFSGNCQKWEYRWTIVSGAATFTHQGATVDTDLAVLTSSPAAQISSFIPIAGKGERFVTFTQSGKSVIGTFWTRLGGGVGTLTAGFLAKKTGQTLPVAGLCAIAGADNLIPEQNQAVDQVVRSQVFTETGELLCTLDRTIDAQKRTIAITVVSGGCTITGDVELRTTTDKTALFINGETQITFEGSHIVCWPNARGSMTCSKTVAGHP